MSRWPRVDEAVLELSPVDCVYSAAMVDELRSMLVEFSDIDKVTFAPSAVPAKRSHSVNMATAELNVGMARLTACSAYYPERQ